MRVFLSWSGARSRAVAEALRLTLPDMVQGVTAFMSKRDLESGERWSLAVADELDRSDFGILCLTPENIDQPWLLFEAGALSKRMGSHACGLLLGDLTATAIAGPLSQFQHRAFGENDIKHLVLDINNQQSAKLTESQIDRIFPKHWPDLATAYQDAMSIRIGNPDDHAVGNEEILAAVSALERRLCGGRVVPQAGYATPDEPQRYEMLMRVLASGLAKRDILALDHGSPESIDQRAYSCGLPPSVYRDLAKYRGVDLPEH